MILEFADGTQLNVKNIFAGPRLIDGIMRDTFRIEIDPSTMGFEDIKKLFNDTNKTSLLYAYSDESNDKTNIGEGYQLFVSITDTNRKVTPPPGRLVPITYEEVYIITMAQLTYEEYQDMNSKNT